MTVIENHRTAQRDPEISGNGPRSASSLQGPGAKERILTTANELFYAEGIRAVGVDRLISESKVTKATFYKHYGAKESLVVSYVQGRHNATRDQLSQIVDATTSPQAALHAMVDNIVAQAHSESFRGCAFINAATEFPEPHHAVREVVSAHRDWYAAFVVDLFRKLGHPMPGDAADDFVLMRDGAMSGGYASDPVAASAALKRCVDRLLEETA